MNKVILVGRLTKDPELKHTTNGNAVCQFTIAVNRQYQSANGEKQADFINCQVWKQSAENLCKYQRKGSLIGLEGQIQTRSYDVQNGVKRFITEVNCENIYYLGTKSDSNASQPNSNNQYQQPSNNSYQAPQNQMPNQANNGNDLFANLQVPDISNDDLPF